jgi:hypothetical protein
MAARLTARDIQLRAIPERAWQAKVQTMLTAFGWMWYHAPDNKPDAAGHLQGIKAGFPDLVAVRGQRVLWIELKRETGKTTPEQDTWHGRLRDAGQEVYVWRPSDSTRVAEVLRPGFAA